MILWAMFKGLLGQRLIIGVKQALMDTIGNDNAHTRCFVPCKSMDTIFKCADMVLRWKLFVGERSLQTSIYFQMATHRLRVSRQIAPFVPPDPTETKTQGSITMHRPQRARQHRLHHLFSIVASLVAMRPRLMKLLKGIQSSLNPNLRAPELISSTTHARQRVRCRLPVCQVEEARAYPTDWSR